MTQHSATPAPEFSRTVIAAKVTANGHSETIEASPSERKALAERLGLLAIETLTATARLRRVRGEMIRVEGRLDADVVQTCVVTLDPIPSHVAEEFSALFAPDHLLPQGEDAEADIVVSVDDSEDDVPEAMPGGRIDLGELVAQHLSLALAPYPRKPGAVFDEIVEDDGSEEPKKPNPFATLAQMKRPS